MVSGDDGAPGRAATFVAGAVLLFACAVPVSIAASQIALTLAVVGWLFVPEGRRVRPSPGLLWAVAAYAVWTLLSALYATAIAEPTATRVAVTESTTQPSATGSLTDVGAEYGPVRSGETLYSISRRITGAPEAEIASIAAVMSE